MFVWGLCCGIDNIGWLVVYHKNREKFREGIYNYRGQPTTIRPETVDGERVR